MYTPRHAGGGGGQEITTPHSAGTPQSPRINDDAAERRRRRKSAIERRRSNLATPRRLSVKTPLFNHSPQLASPAAFAVQLPRLTPEELNQRYEEWMKIAADNKINANNTWDFALIDYFYDMSLLRDGDSINFQKASCTLDGCVKIYSSRVDSVASETGRLLSGLAEAPGKRGQRAGDDADDADGSGEGGKLKSRRTARSATTLAKDFSSISVKKLDLEFSVDPLFKKTSADFDEGGARGLLLNHLGFDAEGRIVFDASESGALVDDGDTAADTDAPLGEQGHDGDGGAEYTAAPGGRHRPRLVDISSMGDIFGAIIEKLGGAQICPSLADFEFTRDASMDFSLLKEHLCDESDGQSAPVSADNSIDAGATEYQDGIIGSFADGGSGDDGDDGDGMGHFLNFDETDAGPVPLETASTLQMAEAAEAAENGGVAAAGFSVNSLKVAEDEDNLLSYFDTRLAKSWAGPEHWRLPISRAAAQKQLQAVDSGDGDGDGDTQGTDDAEAKRKRSEKQAYFTDFAGGDDVDAESLFAKPLRASAITMSKKAAQNQDHTLPEDVHFSSKNLFNLLLKPMLRFNPRRVRTAAGAAGGTGAEPAAAGGGGGSDGYGGFDVDGDSGANIFSGLGDEALGGDGGDAGLDDYDDDDVLQLAGDDGAGGGGGESKSDVPQLTLIKPLHVNYARRAKRVNVKRLKDNLWREIAAGDRRRSQIGLAEPADMSLDDTHAPVLAGDQRFSDIVGGLKNVYPREKLEELSISYCFICLLHLANERNLRIESDASLRDLVISQDSFD
ncbi:hypothetical protein LPJ61_000880 [Coemansia biformis]|uniref:Condensin complex subunit 2 n=1 Tax=Coemansia biformis TaxID=1286918 RepID=A0A9W8D044_9FUNG|nr:hypothetical protein LPJ61_000880 [Coemansia biformis]